MADTNTSEKQQNALDVIETQYDDQGVMTNLSWPLDVNGHIVLGRTATNRINRNENNAPDINLTLDPKHNIAYKHATICIYNGAVTLSPSRNSLKEQTIVDFNGKSIHFNPSTENDVLEEGITVHCGVEYKISFGKLNYSMFIEEENLVLKYESTSLASEA